MIGEQLIEQRKKNKINEEKLEKQQMKIHYLKGKNEKIYKRFHEVIETCSKFVEYAEKDADGKLQIKTN